MHKEVEVKAKLRNPGDFIARLEGIGVKFGPAVNQHDKIFSPKTLESFTTFQTGVSFLRIRNQDSTFLLTLKKSELNELESTEIESEISNPEAIEQIITDLGYKFSVEVRKKRRKANHDEIELCLDEVEGLGTFIELEKLMSMNADVEAVQAELFEFLKQFGVTELDRVTQGYDTLVALAQGK